MTTYHKILLALIAAAYFISPIDIIPDFFIPYLGWFDDTAVIGAILYYMKHGKLPDFFYKKNKKRGQDFSSKSADSKYYGSKASNSDQKPNQQTDQTFNRQSSQKKSTEQHSSYKSSEKREAEQKKESEKSPYQILGLTPKATKEEIQAAYRNAVKQYHPDRVAHLGRELQELANKKFIEIKEAYNTLMRSV
ncbi:MAG: DnaJ domain-containing protein [Desulfamplus sp.]